MQFSFQPPTNQLKTGNCGNIQLSWSFHRGFLLVSHSVGAVTDTTAGWIPPCPGFIKINVDASWWRAHARGLHVWWRGDSKGNFLVACRYNVKAKSVAMAEALAILHGCELGIYSWKSVIIEFDSSESISCLRDTPTMGSWEAFPALVKSKRRGESFQDYRWSWIPRLANTVTDQLASWRCREMCDFIWVNKPPSSLVHVLCNDGFPCPLRLYLVV